MTDQPKSKLIDRKRLMTEWLQPAPDPSRFGIDKRVERSSESLDSLPHEAPVRSRCLACGDTVRCGFGLVCCPLVIYRSQT